MQTKKEGVITIYDKEEVIGIIIRDEKTGKKIILKCEEMDLEEIAKLIDETDTKTKSNKTS